MDERVWTDTPLLPGHPVSVGDTVIEVLPAPSAAFLISGDLENALKTLGPDMPMLGSLEACPSTGGFALRISRHTAFVVCANRSESAVGWHDSGFLISEASDIYTCFVINGPNAADVLAQCDLDIDAPASRSAAVQFLGLTALASRSGDGFHIWVPAAFTTFVSGFLADM